MAPEQSSLDGENSHYDSIEQWDSICRYCFRTISSTRPPVFNPDNCGCVEVGPATHGDEQSSRSLSYGLQGVQCEAAIYHQRPQSTTSSTDSVTCPEGPEREDPNLTIGNAFLPLGPDVGLNEPQHRRSASFRSEMSFQMRRFLVESEPCLPTQLAKIPSSANFLPQDIHIQSQRLEKAKNRSKSSYQSLSSGSGDASIHTWPEDPTVAIGTQFDHSEQACFKNGYPMTMSGMSGYRSEE